MKKFFKIGEISKLYGIGVDSIRITKKLELSNQNDLNPDIDIIVSTISGDSM